MRPHIPASFDQIANILLAISEPLRLPLTVTPLLDNTHLQVVIACDSFTSEYLTILFKSVEDLTYITAFTPTRTGLRVVLNRTYGRRVVDVDFNSRFDVTMYE